MEKIKKAQEELDFIKSATAKELVAYVEEYPLRPRAEKPFVERGIFTATKLYIKKYGLHPNAAVVIFLNNTPELVDSLLEKYADDTAMMKLFLEHGNYAKILKYIHSHDVPALKEQEVLKRFDEYEIIKLLNKNKLSPFGKCDAIMRGSDRLVQRVIMAGGLQKREMDLLLEYANRDIFDFLVANEKNPKNFHVLRQIRLVRFGKAKELAKYVAGQRLHRKAELLFFKIAPFELLVSYVKHYRPEGGERSLFYHPVQSQLLNYLSKNWLSEEGEKLLIQRGKHEEIKAYIKRHNLNDENEVHFIQRGKHREIMLYLSKHSLCDAAQVELIYRRNSIELFVFITAYPLANIAVEALYKCDDIAEIINAYEGKA